MSEMPERIWAFWAHNEPPLDPMWIPDPSPDMTAKDGAKYVRADLAGELAEALEQTDPLMAALPALAAYLEEERKHLVDSFAVPRRANDGSLSCHEENIDDEYGHQLISRIDVLLAPVRAAIAERFRE